MIVLDTNVIYYLCGLSPSPIPVVSLKKYLENKRKTEELCISSVSLYEIAARYHNHAKVFRRIICTLRYYNIRIIDHEYFKKIEPFQKYLRDIKQESLNNLWLEIKENKVEIEARYATIIFIYVISSAILFYCVDDMDKIPDGFILALSPILKLIQEFTLDDFKETFDKGYNTDDCENIIKKEFSLLLEAFLPALISIIKKYSDSTFDFTSCEFTLPENDEDYYLLFKELYKKVKKKDRTMEFVSGLANEFSRKTRDRQLNSYLSDINTTIGNVIKIEAVREYVFQIVNKCLLCSGEFRKNSINDALILSSIGENDFLVSFDNGVIKHLEGFKTNKDNYKNSLNEIYILLKHKI